MAVYDVGIDRLRGFADTWSDEYAELNRIDSVLSRLFESHGFLPIDVPIVERADLFLRKNGADVAAKLYAFEDQGRREVALRPEFTASVIRAASDLPRDGIWPMRVSYTGPVFRYEKPQRGTTRQFTQKGVELLGSASLQADIEMIRLACQATHRAGLTNYHLIIGHIGFVTQFLSQLGIEGHHQHFLVENLEYYNRGPREQAEVHERLGLSSDIVADNPDDNSAAWTINESAQAHNLVATVLSGTEVNLSGSTRSQEEIVARLLRKAQRRDPQERLRQALAFVRELGTLTGPPTEVLAAARQLAARFHIDASPLNDLEAVISALGSPPVSFPWESGRGQLSLGLARGIPYYSGLLFEIHAPSHTNDGAGLQVCGGGRYDGLAYNLTRRLDMPALGFAFGVQRLATAVERSGQGAQAAPRALVILGLRQPERDLDTLERAAHLLRQAGIAVACDYDGRTPRALLAQARSVRSPLVVIADAHNGDTPYRLYDATLEQPDQHAPHSALEGLRDSVLSLMPTVDAKERS